ncbi:MAG: hypothetical protein ACOYON_03020 [Fimbriimonas sp.]
MPRRIVRGSAMGTISDLAVPNAEAIRARERKRNHLGYRARVVLSKTQPRAWIIWGLGGDSPLGEGYQ